MMGARAARGLVLAAWALFFAYLWFSGEVSRYLGPRTYWVVPFGAISLALAALVQLASLKADDRPARLQRSHLVGLAALLIPILAVVMVPRAELGALAASRKSTGGVGAVAAIAPPQPEPGHEPSFIDVHFANESESYAATIGIADGTPMELVGFVTRAPSGGTLELTRFYVSCCAADAIPYTVTVSIGDLSGNFGIDQWLVVRGELLKTAAGYQLSAETIETTQEPQDPYLY